MPSVRHSVPILCMMTVLTGLSSCRDVFSPLYDDETVLSRLPGTLYVDASCWTDWYYVDLTADEPTFSEAFAVPTTPLPDTAVAAADSLTTAGDTLSAGGAIVNYWYDVFGEGLSHYERRSSYATAPQAAPARWTLAVHRNNVRTNGGSVCRTAFSRIADLPPSSSAFADSVFTADTLSEHQVWVLQDRMLEGVIGNQRIAVNGVLSQWLQLFIPPMPPTYVHDPHVFILRLADGTHAALRLADYMDSSGRKCCLTIEYRYPY